MTRSAVVTLAALSAVLLLAAVAAGQTADGAAPDTTVATPPAGGLADVVGQAADLPAGWTNETPATPWLISWTRDPGASVKSGLRSSSYAAGFDNNLLFGDQGRLTQTLLYSYEDYRSQEKIVQKRDGSLNYLSNTERAVQGTVYLGQNWSEDEITNSTGQTTVNKRDFRNARASLSSSALELGTTSHDVSVDGMLSDQQGEQQGQRNDFSEARLQGSLKSKWQPREWMTLRTGAYLMTESGERSLGLRTDPSSANGDSLRAGVGFKRGAWTGFVGVKTSNFEKQYLDYRRNANGVVDTIGVDEKIVDELESDDALTFEWNNTLAFGGATLNLKLAQDMSEKRYKKSGVGTKEKRQDTADVSLGVRVTDVDSVSMAYRYQWRWDDQVYQGATSARGKQIYYNRNVNLTWLRDLFAHTSLRVNLVTGLTQDIAEGRFNENDRDRLDSGANFKLETQWPRGLDVGLVFDARRVEDVAIRSARSANNSIKETYEINPSYGWDVGRGIRIDQDFRVWIQYTDYVYSDLDEVNKQDDYNKRGNLETKLTLNPNPRLRLVLSHNYNIKLIGKETDTDVLGTSYYFRESDQRINKVNVSMTYKAFDWFTLEGTTFKGRDLKESYGTTTRETERFSGELGVGGTVDKKFGDGKKLKAGVRRIFAHGPNVQETGKRYWDADIQLDWRF